MLFILEKSMERNAIVIWGHADTGKTITLEYLMKKSERISKCVYKIKNKNGDEMEIFIEERGPEDKKKLIDELVYDYNNRTLPNNIIVEARMDCSAANTIDFLRQYNYNMSFFLLQSPALFLNIAWEYVSRGMPSISDLEERVDDIIDDFFAGGHTEKRHKMNPFIAELCRTGW